MRYKAVLSLPATSSLLSAPVPRPCDGVDQPLQHIQPLIPRALAKSKSQAEGGKPHKRLKGRQVRKSRSCPESQRELPTTCPLALDCIFVSGYLCCSLPLSLPPSLAPSLSLSLPPSLSLSLFISLSHTHTLSLYLSMELVLSHPLFLCPFPPPPPQPSDIFLPTPSTTSHCVLFPYLCMYINIYPSIHLRSVAIYLNLNVYVL